EDLLEVRNRRTLAEHLVVNAAEERFVDELRGSDVGREHDQQQERQLEFLAVVEREEVDATLERDDPAVEQIARRAALTAEVVDDEHAAVGHRLNGSGVEAGRLRV